MLYKSLIFVLLFSLFMCIPGCENSPADPEDNCELVTEGNSFLKVVNTSGSEIDVFFIGFAFGALITDEKCEVFGMPSGNRAVDVTKRPDGPTRRIEFDLEFGDTFTLRVDRNFF